jgi:VanZ family protein
MTNSTNSHATRQITTILIVIYGGLLLYASLMPYDFTPETDFKQLWQDDFWDHWPFNTRARISGADLVGNIALYIPWGFLIASRLRISLSGYILPLCIATLSCSLLSVSVETLQSTMISRTPSASDWLWNTVSGFAGALIGTIYGPKIWENGCNWLREKWQRSPIDLFTLTFMGLLAADALAPYLPSIRPINIWRRIEKSHFDLFEGFAQHPWHWWLIMRCMVYLILALLLASWFKRAGLSRSRFKAFLAAALFATGLELVKPMIASRHFNIANVASSSAGAFAAFLVASINPHRLRFNRKLSLTVVALTTYVLYLAWTPFDFAYNPELLKQKLPSPTEMLPLYHYAMGAELNHVRLFVQGVALQLILTYILLLRFPRFDKKYTRYILALAVSATLGILQEGGQLFLASRTPSMTDIYCFMLGGVFGAMLPRNHSTQTNPQEKISHER